MTMGSRSLLIGVDASLLILCIYSFFRLRFAIHESRCYALLDIDDCTRRQFGGCVLWSILIT
jgi:hypothetical protein